MIIISLKIDLCYLLYVQRSIANCLRDAIFLYFSVFTYIWINKDCCNAQRFQFSPKPIAVTTGSLDNAIQDFSLAYPLWLVMDVYIYNIHR